MKNFYPASLLCDFYKLSHRVQYPEWTEFVYSTWTPRSNKHYPDSDKVVAFGFQAFIKKYIFEYFDKNFFDRPKEDVLKEYKRYCQYALFEQNPDASHLEELWEVGYLPLEIKALPEGTKVPMRVPMLTVQNTRPRFYWVTNYIETLMSCELWAPSTTATIANRYKEILTKYCEETGGDPGFVPFQGHDFSMRGLSGLESAKSSGAGHLLSFVGTDTIPAIGFMEEFYNADIETELVGTSIPATEHSTMMAGGKGKEFETYKRLITEVYPSGFLSIVSDTWDLWKCLEEIIKPLKDEIMARDGKVVIRPDSGDPADIICGNISAIPVPEWYDVLSSEFKDYLEDYLLDEVREQTPHGEMGPEEYSEIFTQYGNFYKCSILNIEWNRHDKQYYFIDMYGPAQIKVERLNITPEQKGVIEILWDIFGGTLTTEGYKVLDPHIGAIYGDSITPERCEDICKRLKAKGFASTNVVYGIGSYTYQFNTRDTFGFAMKSTAVIVNGEERMIFKDPKTDDGTKKSNTGAVVVQEKYGELICIDKLSLDNVEPNLMRTIYKDGFLIVDDSLEEIRKRMA